MSGIALGNKKWSNLLEWLFVYNKDEPLLLPISFRKMHDKDALNRGIRKVSTVLLVIHLKNY